MEDFVEQEPRFFFKRWTFQTDFWKQNLRLVKTEILEKVACKTMQAMNMVNDHAEREVALIQG